MCLFSEWLAKYLASGLVPGPSWGLAWALRGCQYLGLIGQAGAQGATHLSSGRYGLKVFVCLFCVHWFGINKREIHFFFFKPLSLSLCSSPPHHRLQSPTSQKRGVTASAPHKQ